MNKFDRHAAVPHGPMRRAVDRLILRREQRFDLVVGRVDRAGPAGFVGALAAQLERRLGKRSPFVAVGGSVVIPCSFDSGPEFLCAGHPLHSRFVDDSNLTHYSALAAAQLFDRCRTAYHGWPYSPMRNRVRRFVRHL